MCVRKTPLAEIFYFFPGNGVRKGLDVWRVVNYYCGQAVGKLQGLIDQEKSRQTTEGDADWLNNTPTRAPINDTC
jgi:hypothetical protein